MILTMNTSSVQQLDDLNKLFNPTLPLGLERRITQCLRLSVNFRCHFDCNFCYVVPLRKHRKEKLNVHDQTLSESDWDKFIDLYFKKYCSKQLVGFPISVCASDPSRDIDVVVMVLRKVLEYANKYKYQRSQVYAQFPTTIIVDIHKKESLDRLKQLISAVNEVWGGSIWYAGTAFATNGILSQSEFDLHCMVREFVWKSNNLWFSILTPTVDESYSSTTWKDLMPYAPLVDELISGNWQNQMTINVVEPMNASILPYLHNVYEMYLSFYECMSRYWLSKYMKTFYKENHDDFLLENLTTSTTFDQGVYYIVNEVGIIPGFAREQLTPNGFGCWPIMGCYCGILGFEPGGIVSGCQFGHDELKLRIKDIHSFDDIIQSTERSRNLEAKLRYPFVKKKTVCEKGECSQTECGTFLRGSCPADLYFQNIDLDQQSKSCLVLSKSCDVLIELCKKVGRHIVEISESAVYHTEKSTLSNIIKIQKSKNSSSKRDTELKLF